ncbi:hypothetical protein [Granulicella sibirica]|uniref:hypothetical protein n=1 Tax=Granulicella sibirica TaxID=2479048 RepID=UPI00100904CE|nr:hypothetical protein [Granulicella sibirica]
MHPLRPLAILALVAACASLYAADKKAPPAKPANQYTLFEDHPKEHVAVAAEPCDEPANCSFFRNAYVQHGFLPVRVIITNDSDKPLTLDDVRIQFISENKDILPAALPEDLNRRLYSKKASSGHSIPMPFPGTNIHTHPEAVDKKITDDDRDFGFPDTTVAPHTTQSGYLFYDIRELDDPAMRHAQLYLKEIKFKDSNTQLFDFNLPFDKWLAAQPKPAPKPTTPTK